MFSMYNAWPLVAGSTSYLHGHWPVNYAVINIRDRGSWVLHAESPGLHAEFSHILHAKEFLLYFTWPLPVALLRVFLGIVICDYFSSTICFCLFLCNILWLPKNLEIQDDEMWNESVFKLLVHESVSQA